MKVNGSTADRKDLTYNKDDSTPSHKISSEALINDPLGSVHVQRSENLLENVELYSMSLETSDWRHQARGSLR